MTHPVTPGNPMPGTPAPGFALPGTASPGEAARGRGARGRAGTRACVDLLTVTPDRVRRALWRSFLRCGFPGELDDAVHAAMNVITPVLAARDAEIARLRETVARAGAPAGMRAAARSRGARPEDTVAVSRRLAGRRDPLLGTEQAS